MTIDVIRRGRSRRPARRRCPREAIRRLELLTYGSIASLTRGHVPLLRGAREDAGWETSSVGEAASRGQSHRASAEQRTDCRIQVRARPVLPGPTVSVRALTCGFLTGRLDVRCADRPAGLR